MSGIEKTDSGWRTMVGHESFPGHLRELFADRETAEACRVAMHAEAEREAERAFESQFTGSKRKHAWTVGYHRAQISDLKRRLEWHESKLRVGRQPALIASGAVAPAAGERDG